MQTMSSDTSKDIPTEFKPIISEGHDAVSVRSDAAELVSPRTKGLKHWRLTLDNKGLERVFHFKTFKATWKFMDEVAAKCGQERHHPTWTNAYNKTHIIWTTHKPEGLSTKDICMARFCDHVAVEEGEMDPTAEQQKTDANLFSTSQNGHENSVTVQ